MVTKSKVALATQRREALERQLALAARTEADQKIAAEVESDPKFKKLTAELEEVAEQLHRKRVVVKRKAFAITVRERRLANIPKEIKAIQKAKVAVDREVAGLETREQQLKAAVEDIRRQAAEHVGCVVV